MKTSKYNRFVLVLCGLTILSSCMVGPKFRSPEVVLPDEFVGGASFNTVPAHLTWGTLFGDTILSELVVRGLLNNRDVATAYSRMEQARLNFKAIRANLFPSLAYGLEGSYGTKTPLGLKPPHPVQDYEIGASLGWELDFFGKIRHATEAAKAQLLSSEYGIRATMLSLAAGIAAGYFTLLNYEESLRIARRTYATRTQSLQLIQASYDRGVVSGLDLKQAQLQQATAAVAIPQYERAIAETTHTLSLLLGENAGARIPTGISLMSQQIPESIPIGLPSDLLERRPDVMAAYFEVKAQNALVGVAQAMRFPTLALTGEGGVFSSDITKLFTSSAFIWTAGGSITGPIFQFGKNRRNMQVAREKWRESILNYEQTVLVAMRDVEDALAGVQTYRAQMAAAAKLVEAARQTQLFSQQRYHNGVTSYLEVLDSDRALFQAELEYAQVVQSRLNAFVSLYKALGGGW